MVPACACGCRGEGVALVFRMTGLAVALVLLAGCASIPPPSKAVSPVQTVLPERRGGAPASQPATGSARPSELWTRNLGGPPGRLLMAANGGRIVVLSGEGPDKAAAFDGNGKPLWSFALSDQVLANSDISLDGQQAVFVTWLRGAGGAGRLYAVDSAGVERRLFEWGGPWAPFVRVNGDGSVIALGFDGSVGAMNGAFYLLDNKGDVLGEQSAPRNEFLGYPSADGSLLLLGYRGNRGGLAAPDPRYAGTGVRMFGRSMYELWHVLDYHRPLALAADGSVAVIAGEPEPDGAYTPPPGVPGVPSAYGQILWYDALSGIYLGRYALPYKAGIYRFALADDGKHSAVSLLGYQGSAERPRSQERVLRFGPLGHVDASIDPPSPVKELILSRDGRYLLLVTTVDSTGAGSPGLVLYDELGRQVWALPSTIGIVSAALSGDGSRLAYTDANDDLHMLNTGVH